MVKNNYKIIMGCSCLLLLFSCTLLYLFNDSYAIEENRTKALPTSAFTSNYTGNKRTNLIQDALKNNATYMHYLHNFEIATNYKTSDNQTPLYNMMKNLIDPTTTEKFELIEDNPTEILDMGILYILSHGYNPTNTTNTVFSSNQYGGVSDNNTKQYITQIALWLYLFEHKDKFNDTYCLEKTDTVNACDFYSNTNMNVMTPNDIRTIIKESSKVSGYNYLNYITLLVDKANTYSVYPNSTMIAIDGETLNYIIASDGTSLTTEEITPAAKDNVENYLYYSVTLKDPNKYGAYLVDSNNNKITNTTNLTGSFKIYVPLKEELDKIDLSSIHVNITGTFASLKGYSYRVTDSEEKLLDKNKEQVYSDVLFGYVPTETATASLKLNNIVKISKVDIATKKELPGAILEIKKKETEEIVEQWKSTQKPKYLFLENGDYSLCETIAPEGYELKKECIDFSVKGDKIVSVVMENEKTVDVPNTSMFKSKGIYIFGSIIGILGIGFIIIASKQKNKKAK